MTLDSSFGAKSTVPSNPQLAEVSSSDRRHKKVDRRKTPERRSRKSAGLIYTGEAKRKTIDRRDIIVDRRDVST